MATRWFAILASALGLLVSCGEEKATTPTGQETPAQQEASGEGAVLIEEDFEVDTGPFTAGNTPEGLIQAEGGQLNINAVAGTLAVSAELGDSAQVLRIEADVSSFQPGVSTSVGCQVGEPGNEYRFSVGPVPTISIFRVEGGIANELGFGHEPTLEIAGGTRLRAECLGQGAGLPTRLILYSNDQILVDVEDPDGLGDYTAVSLSGGRYGSEPSQSYFDNLRVTSY